MPRFPLPPYLPRTRDDCEPSGGGVGCDELEDRDVPRGVNMCGGLWFCELFFFLVGFLVSKGQRVVFGWFERRNISLG